MPEETPDSVSPSLDARERDRPANSTKTAFPQFALKAADAKIGEWSGAITDAADSIDQLLGSESLPIPDSIRELVTSTTRKLRDFGTAAGNRDAADMVADLQRTAAAHPAASLGIGAAVGAALAALLVRLGTPTNGASRETASNRSTGGSARTRH